MANDSERQILNPHRGQSSESKVKDARRQKLPINGQAVLIAVTVLAVAAASSVVMTRPQEPTIQENAIRGATRASHSDDSHIGHLVLTQWNISGLESVLTNEMKGRIWQGLTARAQAGPWARLVLVISCT